MQHDTDIVIAGGGLNGTTLALILTGAGFSVTLIDPAPRHAGTVPGFDGRSYSMAMASVTALHTAGLWDAMSQAAQPIHEIKVSDGRPGQAPSPFFLHFDPAEIATGPTAQPMGFMVEDRHARAGLAALVDQTNSLSYLSETSVVSQRVTPGGVEVSLSSGKTLTAKVLIGCDGRGSGVAQRAGIKRMGWDYGQTSLVCALSHEKPHDGIAHQLFLPAGPLAILPLTGNRVGVVWTEETGAAKAIQAMDDAAYLDVLRPRFGDFLGEITLDGDRFTYPLNLTIAERFVAPRVALVGDAAHGIHPIAGQGLNAGLRDIAALAEVLVEARSRGEDVGTLPVLTRYQQWRRFDTATLALATDGFNRLFSNDNSLLRGLRDLGMGMVNALPGLRRGFMREATGQSGDLPKLMRGEPLTKAQ